MSTGETRRQLAYVVGVDVGGTFTDFVLFRPDGGGGFTYYKEPSTPDDPARAVGEGLVATLELAGVPRDAPGVVLHGTTIALNTILQNKGAPVVLITSRGNRDVLEIGRARMPSSFDFTVGKETPVVPRDRVLECGTRIGPDGEPVSEADEREVEALADAVRSAGVSAVAVMLLNSYVHADPERDLVRRLAARLPGVPVVASADVWPEIREYERALVTVLNAQITPLMDGYLGRLGDRLAAAGIRATVFVTASNGGVLGLATARARPIDTILSGPASGVTAAIEIGRAAGVTRLITFDMGGTSADISVVRRGEPELTTQTMVGDLPVILPSVHVISVGAGGGSIVRVDEQGLLKVGPESAGAAPGPAAYGRGGDRPTVTDCYVVNGWIDPESFLGGRMRLDVAAARRALSGVAARLARADLETPEAVAEAALRIATARMATGLLRHLAQKGEDPRTFTLVPFGGAGPTHASFLAEETGIRRILVPRAASTFCALGAVLAPVKRAYAASLGAARRDPASGAAWELLARLEEEAKAWIAGEGRMLTSPAFAYGADMRYAGQAFNVEVRIPDDVRARARADDLYELFHREHERLYGFREERGKVEVITVRLTVAADLVRVPLARIDAAKGPVRPAGTRSVRHGGASRPFAVYRRGDLRAGHRFDGPAIVEQEDTTVVVLPGWGVTVDDFGNLVMERGGQA
ncbi:MAG TPA: hydantoinase/oxoprolinase family protein [Thermodesulfobacteriota bacterium]